MIQRHERNGAWEGAVDLSIEVDGLRLPNPLVIASGPPGNSAKVIARAFDEGWGAVICKTLVLDASQIVNVAPRYARWRGDDGEILGWENIELITDRPFELWLDEFRALKSRYPDRVLIASVMERFDRAAWQEIISRCAETGVDGFELNLSCPHGLPERQMGSAMGQDPAMVREVCQWAREATDKPIWAKLTPNVTDIRAAGTAALNGGASGLSAINTILCVMGIDLDTRRPEPTVEGYSTPGGYSGRAIKPIALRMVVELAQMRRRELGSRAASTNSPSLEGRGSGGGSSVGISRDASPSPAPPRSMEGDFYLSAIGGVERGADAAQFILAGADCVQVCTAAMIHGYELIYELKRGLIEFMHRHGFTAIKDFRGASLPYFATHAELVSRQRSPLASAAFDKVVAWPATSA